VGSNENNKIKLINLPRNIGPAGARNEGLRLSSSDYVVFIDSDDLWAKDIYHNINQTLISDPAIDILIGCVEHFFSPEIEDKLSHLYKLPPISKAKFGGSLIIKRSALLKSGGFNPTYRNRGEWIDLMSKLLMYEPKIIELDAVFFKRRIHDDNYSHRHKDLTSYMPALRENILRKRQKK
jgi:glycosyltransferase involved in cell wall biosynthesis